MPGAGSKSARFFPTYSMLSVACSMFRHYAWGVPLRMIACYEHAESIGSWYAGEIFCACFTSFGRGHFGGRRER